MGTMTHVAANLPPQGSKELGEALEATEERIAVLAQAVEEGEVRLEEMRDERGRLVALGENDRSIARQIAALVEDLEGRRRAIAVLEGKIVQLEGLKKEAQRREVTAEAEAAMGDAVAIAVETYDVVMGLVRDELAPRIARMNAVVARAQKLDYQARSLRGERIPSESTVWTEIARERPVAWAYLNHAGGLLKDATPKGRSNIEEEHDEHDA